MQLHLKIDKITNSVLLPGDPGRIDKILRYLSNVSEISSNREFRTCEGDFNGTKISAVSTGVGCPAAAIAAEELAMAGAKNLIRIGTCGGLLKEMKTGDIVIPSESLCLDGTTKEYQENLEKVSADKSVLNALIQASKNLGFKCFIGLNRTHDAFYEPPENFLKLKNRNIISSEMECSAIFFIAKLRNLRAGAVLVVNTPEAPEYLRNNSEIYKLSDDVSVTQGIENAIMMALEAVRIIESDS